MRTRNNMLNIKSLFLVCTIQWLEL